MKYLCLVYMEEHTLAQVSDVIFLFLLALMLKKLGYKKTIFLGIFAWTARYFLLAGSVTIAGFQAPLIFGAILLHGVCYDFLFIAGQLYVDDEANERIRGACQGFIAFILWGIGAFVGTMLAGKVLALHTLPGVSGPLQHNWRDIWLTPAFGASTSSQSRSRLAPMCGLAEERSSVPVLRSARGP